MKLEKPALLVLLFGLYSSACRTALPPPNQFRDDWTGLLLAVTKIWGTQTYYLGSDDKWSYFETKYEESLVTPTYRKAETSRLNLRRVFPFQTTEAYRTELADFNLDQKPPH